VLGLSIVQNIGTQISIGGTTAHTLTIIDNDVPTVTLNTANLAQNATTLIIAGTGFSTTPANNTVVLNSGTATVTAATATQLTCTLGGPPSLGNLTAIVTSNSVSSGAPVQVATIVPAITANAANLAANATSLVINGFGFSATPANNTVLLTGGTAGTVTAASATQLTVNVSNLTSGSLTATVSVGGFTSASAQVATVTPVITSSTANVATNASSMVINGFGFSTTPANNVLTFSGAITGTRTVTASSATTLTVTLSGQVAGALNAAVLSNSQSSGAPVQVATVVALSITSNATSLAQNAPQLIINGAGFSATPANNSVVLSSGSATVTAATSTQLTCTLGGSPSLGVLNATVTRRRHRLHGTHAGGHRRGSADRQRPARPIWPSMPRP